MKYVRNAAICILMIVGLPVLWIESSYVRGELRAHLDVHHGNLTVMSYGMPAPETRNYREILSRKYHVQFWSSGCIVYPGLISYQAGYNRVSQRAIDGKFGPRVLESAWREAQDEFRAHQKTQAQTSQLK